jgi:hypothetical protein
MKCRNCESEAKGGENFCDACGKPVLLENPELARCARGLSVGRVALLLVALGSMGASFGMYQLTSSHIDLQISVVRGFKSDPHYDPAKVDAELKQLRDSKDRWANFSMALVFFGILYGALFAACFFKPFLSFSIGGALLLGSLIVVLAVQKKEEIMPIGFAVVPLLLCGGLYYGAKSARRRMIAVEESRAKTQPKPIVRAESLPRRPEPPPSDR